MQAMSIVANTSLVLREEYDDYAILFNPDTAEVYGLNPISVTIYKHLDGKNSLDDIMSILRNTYINIPDSADQIVKEYLDKLLERGLAFNQRNQI